MDDRVKAAPDAVRGIAIDLEDGRGVSSKIDLQILHAAADLIDSQAQRIAELTEERDHGIDRIRSLRELADNLRLYNVDNNRRIAALTKPLTLDEVLRASAAVDCGFSDSFDAIMAARVRASEEQQQ